jgi:hypothetical protein
VVEHHEIHLVAAEELERLLAAGREENLAGLLEHRTDGLAHADFVIDHQDRASRDSGGFICHGKRRVQRAGRKQPSTKSE